MAVVALTLAGQALGGYAGAAFGAAAIGGSIGGAVGMAVGNALFGPKPVDQYGPRVSELETAKAGEGSPIPISWGTMRVPAHVIWAPDLIERARKTSSSGKGSSGPSSTTYYATGSWTASFGHNRVGVPRVLRRVWANKELVYDATNSGGPTLKAGFTFTFYDGTQTVPDPTMEGTIGAGNVPAYTGQALLVFDDLNLEAYGNRIPSIEAELVDNGTNTTSLSRIDLSEYGYPAGPTTNSAGNGNIWFDDVRKLVWVSFLGSAIAGGLGALFVVNPYTNQVVFKQIYADAQDSGGFWLANHLGAQDIAIVVIDNDLVYVYDTETFAFVRSKAIDYMSPSQTLAMFQGVVFIRSDAGALSYWAGDDSNVEVMSVPTGYVTSQIFAVRKEVAFTLTGDRDVYSDEANCFLQQNASAVRYGYFSLHPPTLVASAPYVTEVASVGVYASGPVFDGAAGFVMPTGNFIDHGIFIEATASYWFPFIDTGTTLCYIVEVNPDDGAIIGWYDIDQRCGTTGFQWTALAGYPYLSYDAGSNRIWFTGSNNLMWFSPASKNGGAYAGIPADSGVYYHYESGVAYGLNFYDNQPTHSYDHVWLFDVENVDQSTIAVASVVRDISERVGVTSVTFTGVDDTIAGAIANQQMPARNMINPLLQYALSDGYESEYGMKFVKRGAAVATTLSEDYIGAVTGGKSDDLESTIPHHLELPRALDLRFMNVDNSFQLGDAHYTWHTSTSNRKSTLTLPLAITADEALNRASLLLHMAYQHSSLQLAYGPRYAAVEPTDVINVPVNGVNERVRVENIRRGVNGIRKVFAVIDNVSDYTSFVSAAVTNVRDVLVKNTGPQFTFWLDTPLLQDTDDDHPGPYVALYNYASGFPTGFLYTSPDNNIYNEAASFDTEPAYGLVASVPSNVSDFGQWDTENTIAVEFVDGVDTINSISSAALFANGNAAAWGKPGRWEIVQFLSVAVTSTNTRELTSLLRGRRGSDAHINSHQANDWFVLLDETSLSRLRYGVNDIDGSVYTRAVQPGESYVDISPSIFTITKTALKPYSPISAVVASASTGGDLQAHWTRRTRYGGSDVGLYDNVGGSLSEDSEAYELDIINPGTGLALASGIALTSTGYFYASASQVADGTDKIGTISFNIFQISAAVGRGSPASVSYDRPWEAGYRYAANLGAKTYLPLNDAGTATLGDYFGSAVGVWPGSTGVASGYWNGAVKRVPASVNADSSTSTAIVGSKFRDDMHGQQTITLAGWFDADSFASSDQRLISVPSGSANACIFRFNTVNFQPVFYPNGAGGGISGTGALATKEQGRPIFVAATLNTVSRIVRTYVNGELKDTDAYGTGHGSYADPISLAAYSSAFPGRLFSNPAGNGNYFVGRSSDVMMFQSELSAAQVSVLHEKQHGYIDRVETLGATHLWTLDQTTSKISSTEPDRAGVLDMTYTFYTSQASAVLNAARFGGTFTALLYADRALPSDMKSQVFTIEGWVEFANFGTNEPWLTFWPAGAYASAKGVQLLADATNGIRVRYGPGDGVFRYINASATTGKKYHVVVAKASAAAPKLYVNGSAIGAGASAFDIDWDDATGTPAPPSGMAYINRSNQSATASTGPDTNGADCNMNMIATYATALSSAVIVDSYKFGNKLL